MQNLEVSKILLNKRLLAAELKDVPMADLDLMLEKLSTVVEERLELEAKLSEERKRKEVALMSVVDKIREMDVDIQDVIRVLGSADKSSAQVRKRPRRPAKYKYVDDQGQEKTWTGQGRTPSAMQNAIDKGESRLEDFLI